MRRSCARALPRDMKFHRRSLLTKSFSQASPDFTEKILMDHPLFWTSLAPKRFCYLSIYFCIQLFPFIRLLLCGLFPVIDFFNFFYLLSLLLIRILYLSITNFYPVSVLHTTAFTFYCFWFIHLFFHLFYRFLTFLFYVLFVLHLQIFVSIYEKPILFLSQAYRYFRKNTFKKSFLQDSILFVVLLRIYIYIYVYEQTFKIC